MLTTKKIFNTKLRELHRKHNDEAPTGCRDLLWVVPQVQFCVWPGGGSGLQPRGCSPDTYDEPERRNSVPGHTGLYTAGQRHSPIAQNKHLRAVQIVFVDD